MRATEPGTSEAAGHVEACRARADAYERHLTDLRQKLATYEGGYPQAVRMEAEEVHCRWLLANQDLFAAVLSRR